MSLKHLTDTELYAELERRKQAREVNDKPKPVEDPNWDLVARMCRDEIDQIESNTHDEDMRQYIYEAALTAVFGVDVFKWINKRI